MNRPTLYAASAALLLTAPESDAEVNRGADGHFCHLVTSGLARCPFLDERPGLEHYAVYDLNVHLISNGSSSSATACVNYWDASGGACDSTISVSGTGYKTINIDGSAISLWWHNVANGYDFAYVSVSGASGTTVQGIWYGEQP
jgi:hypothetical protein